MRRWLIPVSVVPALVLLLAACEGRQPLNRGQAVAAADNLQRERGWAWGDPEESLEPAAPGADGRRWWQMRYRGDHYILVDGDTSWARLPPPGYVPRVRATGGHPAQPVAVEVVEGSLVLRLTEPAELDGDGLGALEREAVRLNELGAKNGLHALFSVRTDRQGRTALLYGWQGDRGIARDTRITDWVTVRTRYSPVWVDLLPE